MQILIVFIFLTVLALTLLAAGLGTQFLEKQRRKRVGEMLETVEHSAFPEAKVLLERASQEDSSLVRLLSKFDFARKMEMHIQQAGLDWTLSRLVFSMAIAAVVGALLGMKLGFLLYAAPSALAAAVVFSLFPWLYVLRKASKRLAAFEEEFPEALDFLARALRAGHAFAVSLEMLSVESPEPLRSEFLKVYNEQNLGESLPVVLQHLAERIPLVDVRFFVAAVLMQRESGGNLGEILTKLSSVIRDRFRLKGQVKALSAHSRITALVLTCLPVATALLLMVIAPEYLPSMYHDKHGQFMIAGALMGQVVGYIVMRKIINIKV